ncbi:hypothetical protein [Streptomyces graminilatus]|uniref:hypothetical protein n=1 Tax=Streptomyces graminilatus TaxID=1464070 RepID=UPI0006E1F502|nr:hypothetical protein [Streptomyces graminilatus]
MITLQLLSTVIAMSLERLFAAHYGALGVVCLFLLGAGLRARNAVCVYTGTVLFVLLMVQA